jgi:hypothetical protein
VTLSISPSPFFFSSAINVKEKQKRHDVLRIVLQAESPTFISSCIAWQGKVNHHIMPPAKQRVFTHLVFMNVGVYLSKFRCFTENRQHMDRWVHDTLPKRPRARHSEECKISPSLFYCWITQALHIQPTHTKP